MSPPRSDASQGAFFEVYGNLILLYFLYYKKSVQDGIRDSFAHMSPSRGDASQGAFFEVYGNLILLYFLYYKKSVQDGIRDSFAHMSPSRGDAPQGTFFEIYGNLVNDISYTIKKEPEINPIPLRLSF